MSRFNLRQMPRVSYCEPEEPNLDEYIFCDKCGDYVYEYCSIHGALLVVPDDKVSGGRGRAPAGVPRAALTVPHVFLHLACSVIPGAGIGVFTTLTLPRGVRFGPYRGQRSLRVASPYCWQIYDSHNKPAHVVDAADDDKSNWMRYVNCARHWCEQNLVAFQYRGELYYRTIKIVPRFTELMVFYGTEFAHSLDIDVRSYNSPPGYAQKFGAPAPKKLKLDSKTGPAAEGSSRSGENQKPGVEGNAPAAEESNGNTSRPPVHSEATDTQQQYKQRKTKKFVTPKIKKTKADKADNRKPVFKAPRKLETQSKPNSLLSKRKLDSQNERVQDNTPKPSVCDDRAETIKEPKANGITHLFETPNNSKYQSKPVTERASETNATTDTNNNCASDNNELFPCNMCSKQFNTEALLIQHVHSHTACFNCSECGYSTAARDTFEKHLGVHDKSRAHQCDVCGHRFVNKWSLQKHISRVHIKDTVSIKRHSCDICDYKTDNICHLERHLNVHGNIKPYSCTMCTYKCDRKSHLKIHERTHTGEKPFSCSICTYKCTQKSNLIIHEKTHTGEKPFSCSICTYKCTQKSHLKIHEKTHTGEKPFSCSICTYKCTQKSHLKTHERTHTGEKPFSCSLCTYKCSQKSSLKTHERTHTGEDPFVRSTSMQLTV